MPQKSCARGWKFNFSALFVCKREKVQQLPGRDKREWGRCIYFNYRAHTHSLTCARGERKGPAAAAVEDEQRQFGLWKVVKAAAESHK